MSSHLEFDPDALAWSLAQAFLCFDTPSFVPVSIGPIDLPLALSPLEQLQIYRLEWTGQTTRVYALASIYQLAAPSPSQIVADETRSLLRQALEATVRYQDGALLRPAPVLGAFADLEGAQPDSLELVPMPSSLARAVKNWLEALEGDHPTGQLARGVREVVLGLNGGGSRQVADGLDAQVKALRALLKAAKRRGGSDGGNGGGGQSLQ